MPPLRLVPARRAALLLASVITLIAGPARAQSGLVWGMPAGSEPCAAELRLAQSLAADPGLAARRALFESLYQAALEQGLVPRASAASGPSFVIPIVVHIVHQNGAENISDQQVQSQIWALNRDFANSVPSPSPAVNTGIQFCLATQLPPASTVTWSTTPGITRAVSPETNHIYGNPTSELALKAIDYLPSAKYLNVWVVKNISGGGGGVAGYATFPGTTLPTLDGIVIRYTAFGSDFSPFGGPYPNLLPFNNDGKIMTHEVGHWLNLQHTFSGGCAPPGDFVSDTPPEAVARNGCPTTALTSCTSANDPIENFMDYTNDPCRFAFTAGQSVRMQTAIGNFRSQLVSAQNLIDVGCPSGLNALITATRGQLCPADTTTFGTPASGAGYTYAWSFPGGTPATANTQYATVSYAAPGVYSAMLTVTDGGSNSSTNSLKVYVRPCTPITGACANWVMPSNVGLSFASGVPKPVSGRKLTGVEPAGIISDAAGNVVFYADGDTARTRTNVPMPNGGGLLAGGSSHKGVLILPRPGSSTQYFLFTVRQWEDSFTPNPMNYSVVDMTLNAGLGDIPGAQKNLVVALPGTPNQLVEGMAAIPHCNGTDWWLVTNGSGTGSGKLYVTLVTSAGPVSSTAYPIGLSLGSAALGSVVPSADGTRIAVCASVASAIAVYNFNRTTGVPTTLLPPTTTWDAYSDIAFSPNGNIVYFNNEIASVPSVKQLDLTTLQVRDILVGQYVAINLGPDGLVYLSPAFSNKLGVINFPDNFNTANANECGFNPNSVPLPAGSSILSWGSLPNMPLQCTTQQPADFSYNITSCLTVNLTALNCAGPYTWNFGDSSPTASGASVSHTYAASGTYAITLTVPSASPTTKVVNVTLGLAPVTIAGPSIRCDSTRTNYSAVGPAGYTYSWTVSGGSPAAGTGNNIDVIWGVPGGTITLLATDPATGCSATIVKTVGPCPTCAPPPAGMSAWFPLDEASGTLAQEIVLSANGTDQNAPLHTVAKVRRGRALNGINQYVQANDAAGLNFGTGDLTVDAWVRTTDTTGVAPIVDKRLVDPEQGYALYLKSGRLALRLADFASAIEYWSPSTPFVADGQWHHVAGVLRRSAPTNGTRLFVDGVGVASFPAFSGGSVTNTEKLLIGAEAGFSGPLGYLDGGVDEVELFQRSLNGTEVASLYLADSLGKCKEFSYVPPMATICRDQANVTITMQLCNYTSNAQSYNITFAPQPVGPGCTYAGPTSFTLLSPNPVSVPAGGCVNVQYKVGRPAGMPLYATSCYSVTATNTTTSASMTNTGAIYSARRWCNIIAIGPVGVGGFGGTARVAFGVTATGDVPASTPYAIRVRPSGGISEVPPVVGLAGVAPGDAQTGTLDLVPGQTATLEVSAIFTQPRPFRYYDVELSLDEDGDGLLEPVVTTGITYGVAAPPVSVPPTELPVSLRLGVTPNPVRGTAVIRYGLPVRGRVELALYDVAGRMVRRVPSFSAEAGNASLTLDCRGLSRGVYFVRLRLNGDRTSQRFMLVP